MPGNGSDAGQSGAEATALADATGEAGRDVARSAVEAEVGRSGADSAARPVGEEGSGGGAQERPAGQAELETLIPEPSRAGVEGVSEESA